MKKLVAPGARNVLRQTSLRMCAMTFAAPPVRERERPEDKNERSEADQLLDALSLEILREGYVILLPLSDGVSSLAPSAKSAVLARTIGDGTLVWITQGELDAPPPADPGRTLWFEQGATWVCFWTRCGALARHVWGLVQADVIRATTCAAPFSVFHVGEHQLTQKVPNRLGLEPASRRKLELLLTDADGRLSGKLVHGFFSAPEARLYGLADAESPGSYVMARSDAVACVFAAHVMELQFQHTRWLAGETWMTLARDRELAEQGAAGARRGKLDDALSTVSVGSHAYRAGDWNEGYERYAYKCARAGVSRALFRAAIDVGSPEWRAAAEAIAATPAGPHPASADDEKRWPLDRMPNAPAVLGYFDFYDFGVRNEHASWHQVYLDAADKAIDREHERLRAAKQALLVGRGRYWRFMQEIGAHCRDDETLRAMHSFYLDVAIGVHFRWWEREDQDTWSSIKSYLDATATLTSKPGDLFKEHFEKPHMAAAYNEALAGGSDLFEDLFKKLSDYDHRFEGETVTREYKGYRLEANFKDKTLTIQPLGGGEPVKVEAVHFLVEVEEKIEMKDQVVAPRKGNAMKRKVIRRPAPTQVGRVFVHDLPFKSIHRWPVWLNAFGNFVALGVMVKDAAVGWRDEDRLQIAGKLGMNLFQAVDSLGSVLEMLRLHVPELLGKVGVAGNAIEAYYAGKEGWMLLYDYDTSEAAVAVRQGDEVQACAKLVKGGILLSSAAVGTVSAAISALSPAAAALPVLGIGLVVPLAIGALSALLINAYLADRAGPINEWDDEQARIGKLFEREWGGKAPIFGRTAERIANLVATADTALRRIA